MELIIDPEFKNLIPLMKPEEFQGLIESIAKYGYDDLYPIVIWNDIIIDGHNRYLICKELNIDFSVSEKDFDNRVEVINWIINNQLNRRSMTNEQRNYLIGKRYQEEKKEECKQKIKEDDKKKLIKIFKPLNIQDMTKKTRKGIIELINKATITESCKQGWSYGRIDNYLNELEDEGKILKLPQRQSTGPKKINFKT